MLIRPVRKLLSRFMSMRVFVCLAVFFGLIIQLAVTIASFFNKGNANLCL